MLSAIVAQADLALWPQLGLIIFFVTFVGIVLWTFRRGSKARYADAARIPLDDERDQNV